MDKNKSRLTNIFDEEYLGDGDKPTPHEFATFVSWACLQMQMEFVIFVSKSIHMEYVSSDKMKGKSRQRTAESEKIEVVPFPTDMDNEEKVVKILAIYEGQQLTHIKFEKNIKIPRMSFKIVGMTVAYHPNLNRLTIKGGLDGYGIYEISKFLNSSYLTDICLDGSFVPEGNFYLLLEDQTRLKSLSLSRCSINDEVVKTIANTLIYPKPASTTLEFLYLSINFITNIGAKYLADVLRTNKRLKYLNLSNNKLDDFGADYILNVLEEFPLTYDEIIDKKKRHFDYLRKKKNVFDIVLKELKSEEENKVLKRKTASPSPIAAGKKVKETTSTIEENFKRLAFDEALNVRADERATEIIGKFNDPFNKENTIIKDGYTYCLGNNTLSYLNLSYNNLMYPTVKKLLKVFEYQKYMNRKPKGLIVIIIEGNNMPESCMEYGKINDIIQLAINPAPRRLSGKKKVGKK